MKGFYESKESVELDKENSIIINKQKTEEFSQINIDFKESTEDDKSAGAEIQPIDQSRSVINRNEQNSIQNPQVNNNEESTRKSSTYETLDESYGETFVN